MSEDDDHDLEDATPAELEAEEQRIAALNAEILDFQRQGWTWNKADNLLIHPHDASATIWIAPYTGEKLYSPGLLELLRQYKDGDKGVADAGQP